MRSGQVQLYPIVELESENQISRVKKGQTNNAREDIRNNIKNEDEFAKIFSDTDESSSRLNDSLLDHYEDPTTQPKQYTSSVLSQFQNIKDDRKSGIDPSFDLNLNVTKINNFNSYAGNNFQSAQDKSMNESLFNIVKELNAPNNKLNETHIINQQYQDTIEMMSQLQKQLNVQESVPPQKTLTLPQTLNAQQVFQKPQTVFFAQESQQISKDTVNPYYTGRQPIAQDPFAKSLFLSNQQSKFSAHQDSYQNLKPNPYIAKPQTVQIYLQKPSDMSNSQYQQKPQYSFQKAPAEINSQALNNGTQSNQINQSKFFDGINHQYQKEDFKEDIKKPIEEPTSQNSSNSQHFNQSSYQFPQNNSKSDLNYLLNPISNLNSTQSQTQLQQNSRSINQPSSNPLQGSSILRSSIFSQEKHNFIPRLNSPNLRDVGPTHVQPRSSSVNSPSQQFHNTLNYSQNPASKINSLTPKTGIPSQSNQGIKNLQVYSQTPNSLTSSNYGQMFQGISESRIPKQQDQNIPQSTKRFNQEQKDILLKTEQNLRNNYFQQDIFDHQKKMELELLSQRNYDRMIAEELPVFCINCEEYIPLPKMDKHTELECENIQKAKKDSSPSSVQKNAFHPISKEETIQTLNEKIGQIEQQLVERLNKCASKETPQMVQLMENALQTTKKMRLCQSEAEQVSGNLRELRDSRKKIIALKGISELGNIGTVILWDRLILLGEEKELKMRMQKNKLESNMYGQNNNSTNNNINNNINNNNQNANNNGQSNNNNKNININNNSSQNISEMEQELRNLDLLAKQEQEKVQYWQQQSKMIEGVKNHDIKNLEYVKPEINKQYQLAQNFQSEKDSESVYSVSKFSVFSEFNSPNRLIQFNQSIEEKKKSFFSLALNLKFKLPVNHHGRGLSMQDLFDQSQKENIPQNKWADFIRSKIYAV